MIKKIKKLNNRTHGLKKSLKKKSQKSNDPPSNYKNSLAKTSDPLSMYLMEISKYPLLSKEEEFKWAKIYHETKDLQALGVLIKSNLRFVVKIALEYSKFGSKLIDLIQEGNVGLLKAIKEFSPYRDVRLITYAVWWIRGAIREYLLKQHSIVKIATTPEQKKLFYLLKKQNLPDIESTKDISLLSKSLNISSKEIESMKKRLSQHDVSIDSHNNPSFLIKDFIEVEEQSPDQEFQNKEQIQNLKKTIQKLRKELTKKEIYILDHRTLNHSPKTLQEIGRYFGITREAIRQIETKLLKKIKQNIVA